MPKLLFSIFCKNECSFEYTDSKSDSFSYGLKRENYDLYNPCTQTLRSFLHLILVLYFIIFYFPFLNFIEKNANSFLTKIEKKNDTLKFCFLIIQRQKLNHACLYLCLLMFIKNTHAI